MHGMFFAQLQKFITNKWGNETWSELLHKAGISPKKIYLTVEQPPIMDIVQFISNAAKMTGKTEKAFGEELGEFIAPYMMDTYGKAVPSTWRTIDIAANENSPIYQLILTSEPGLVVLPSLKGQKVSPTRAVVKYSSPRKLCAIGVGMLYGIANLYGEKINVIQPKCLLKGDDYCEIIVDLIKSGDKVFPLPKGTSESETAHKH
jgi:hypothetical protein